MPRRIEPNGQGSGFVAERRVRAPASRTDPRLAGSTRAGRLLLGRPAQWEAASLRALDPDAPTRPSTATGGACTSPTIACERAQLLSSHTSTIAS